MVFYITVIIVLYFLKKLQEMTNNVRLTFSVCDSIPQFTISVEQDN